MRKAEANKQVEPRLADNQTFTDEQGVHKDVHMRSVIASLFRLKQQYLPKIDLNQWAVPGELLEAFEAHLRDYGDKEVQDLWESRSASLGWRSTASQYDSYKDFTLNGGKVRIHNEDVIGIAFHALQDQELFIDAVQLTQQEASFIAKLQELTATASKDDIKRCLDNIITETSDPFFKKLLIKINEQLDQETITETLKDIAKVIAKFTQEKDLQARLRNFHSEVKHCLIKELCPTGVQSAILGSLHDTGHNLVSLVIDEQSFLSNLFIEKVAMSFLIWTKIKDISDTLRDRLYLAWCQNGEMTDEVFQILSSQKVYSALAQSIKEAIVHVGLEYNDSMKEKVNSYLESLKELPAPKTGIERLDALQQYFQFRLGNECCADYKDDDSQFHQWVLNAWNSSETSLQRFDDFYFINKSSRIMRKYAGAVTDWSPEELANYNKAKSIIALFKEKNELAYESRQFLENITDEMHLYCTNHMVDRIQNYFAMYQQNADQVYPWLYDPAFREACIVTDKIIQEWDEQAENGILFYNPYCINRILITALIMPIQDWTSIFAKHLEKVNDLISSKEKYAEESVQAQIVRDSSYSKRFCVQMKSLLECYNKYIDKNKNDPINSTIEYPNRLSIRMPHMCKSVNQVLSCSNHARAKSVGHFDKLLPDDLLTQLTQKYAQSYPAETIDESQLDTDISFAVSSCSIKLLNFFLETYGDQAKRLLELNLNDFLAYGSDYYMLVYNIILSPNIKIFFSSEFISNIIFFTIDNNISDKLIQILSCENKFNKHDYLQHMPHIVRYAMKNQIVELLNVFIDQSCEGLLSISLTKIMYEAIAAKVKDSSNDIYKALVKKGIGIDYMDDHGDTVISIAIDHENSKVIGYVFEKLQMEGSNDGYFSPEKKDICAMLEAMYIEVNNYYMGFSWFKLIKKVIRSDKISLIDLFTYLSIQSLEKYDRNNESCYHAIMCADLDIPMPERIKAWSKLHLRNVPLNDSKFSIWHSMMCNAGEENGLIELAERVSLEHKGILIAPKNTAKKHLIFYGALQYGFYRLTVELLTIFEKNDIKLIGESSPYKEIIHDILDNAWYASMIRRSKTIYLRNIEQFEAIIQYEPACINQLNSLGNNALVDLIRSSLFDLIYKVIGAGINVWCLVRESNNDNRKRYAMDLAFDKLINQDDAMPWIKTICLLCYEMIMQESKSDDNETELVSIWVNERHGYNIMHIYSNYYQDINQMFTQEESWDEKKFLNRLQCILNKYPELLTRKDKTGLTPLDIAIEDNEHELVKQLQAADEACHEQPRKQHVSHRNVARLQACPTYECDNGGGGGEKYDSEEDKYYGGGGEKTTYFSGY